jgi:hypothetical protein
VESNRCRYHCPGEPSASVTRVHAGPPKTERQSFGGSSPSGARPVAEVVAAPLEAAGEGGERRLEPAVLAARVVRDDVHHHPHAELVRPADQGVRVVQGAEDGVDVAVVRDVVPRVVLR